MNVNDSDEKRGKGSVFVEGSPQRACDRNQKHREDDGLNDEHNAKKSRSGWKWLGGMAALLISLGEN